MELCVCLVVIAVAFASWIWFFFEWTLKTDQVTLRAMRLCIVTFVFSLWYSLTCYIFASFSSLNSTHVNYAQTLS